MSIKKKLIISAVVFAIIAAVLLPLCLYASFVKDENKFVYRLEGDVYVIEDIKNDYRDGWFGKEKLVVPSTHKGKPVVKLERLYSTGVQELIISDGIQTISDSAFANDAKMKKIDLPDTLKEMGNMVFGGCKSLTDVTIPDAVEVIGNNMFVGCSALISINVGSNSTKFRSKDGNLYSIDGKTFIQYAKGKSATSFTIPDGVEDVCGYAFSESSSLMSVLIPDGVKSIGNNAFSSCGLLMNLTIPDSVTSIGAYAFSDCNNLIKKENGVQYADTWIVGSDTSLIKATLKSGIKGIAGNAFFNCKKLTSITIPIGVTSLGDMAFCNCEKLTSITIPDGVTNIGSSAFNGCSTLTNITIPNSVTSLGDLAFSSCFRLKDITFGGTMAQWETIEKGGSWNVGTGNYTVHCTDGDIAKN